MKRLLSAILGIIVFFCACAQNSASQLVSESQSGSEPLSSVPLPEKALAPLSDNLDWRGILPEDKIYLNHSLDGGFSTQVDAYGVVIESRSADAEMLINDVFTGEAIFIQRSKIENVNGEPVQKSALFSKNEELVIDYDKYQYSDAFGDFLIQSYVSDETAVTEGHKSNLLNYKTGKLQAAGIGNIYSLDKKSRIAALCDDKGKILFSADEDANKLIDAPKDIAYYAFQSFESGILAALSEDYGSETTKFVVLDKNLNRINDYEYTSPDSYASPLNGGIRLTREGKTCVLDKYGNEQFIAEDMVYFNYIDEELAVGYYPSTSNLAMLMSMDGKTKFEAEQIFAFSKSNVKASLFVSRKGEIVQLISRDGEVVAEARIPHLSLINAVNGEVISCSTAKDSCLLNENLQYLIEPGKYSSIEPFVFTSPDKSKTAMMYVCFKITDEKIRSEILAPSLKVISDNIVNVSDFGFNRFFVEKEKSLQLIDFSGEIIAELEK